MRRNDTDLEKLSEQGFGGQSPVSINLVWDMDFTFAQKPYF